jgi:hypothetical protein
MDAALNIRHYNWTDYLNRDDGQRWEIITGEILSPSTLQYDRLRKTQLYARFDIKEYWIVTPYPALVEVMLLDGETYRIHRVYGRNERLKCPSFPWLEIDWAKVFCFSVPPDEHIDEVREGTPEYAFKVE